MADLSMGPSTLLAPPKEKKDPTAKGVPVTGGARAVAAWLWHLYRTGQVAGYQYHRELGRFLIAVTPEENHGWGEARWSPPVHDVASAVAVCHNLDPLFAHAPPGHLEKLQKLTASMTARPKRAGLAELRKLLVAIHAAVDDEVLLPDHLHAAVALAIA